MFCIHCGKAIPENARFCYSCGRPQAPAEEEGGSPLEVPAPAPLPLTDIREEALLSPPIGVSAPPVVRQGQVSDRNRRALAAGLILLALTAGLGWVLYHFVLRTVPAPDVTTATPSTIVATQSSSTSVPASPETEDEKILYSMGLVMGKNLAHLRLNEAELNLLMEGMTDAVLKNREKISLNAYGPNIKALTERRMAAVPKADAQPSVQAHPGFKARFECSMMGQPTALVTCLQMSSISVVSDSGVREFNVRTLPGGGVSTFLDVDLPEHFKIRAPNGSKLPLSLRLTVRDRSGKVVFSDAAGPGRSVNLEN